MIYTWVGLLLSHARADCQLEAGIETSFLQISIENVTLHSVSEGDAWIGMENMHLSIYLICFLLIPICAVAFAGPRWALATMITCADSLCTELPMAIFALVAEDPFSLGALVATKPLGQALATPLVIQFTRQRELHSMKLGLLLQSAGLFLQAFTPSLGAWFAARAAQGVGSALMLGAISAMMGDATKETGDSGRGLFTYSMWLGLICGAPFGGICFAIESFLPFLFLGLADLILLTALHFKMDAPSKPMPGIPRDVLAPLRYPMISRPLALLCLVVMYGAALQAMIFKVMEEDLQLGVVPASFTWLFQAWPMILTSLLLGPAAQGIGFRLIMLTGLLVVGSGALIVDDKSFMCLIAELVVAGLALGAENATVPRLLEDVASRNFDDTSATWTLLNLGQQIGYVLGPLIGAVLYHVGGLRTMCRAFGVLLIGYALSHTVD
ncbi:Probable vesicular acetylcholine transporter-A (VAChT-A) (Solute carrier family 18 member 3-A) [Durusdinium trenchii]|uniref:Probable vesicular acetylcholine transporter-A (VAChT-A) (Solute carrier family 18 member 3-A) n=1 Tax=Durusdinium trenchii TaxID=1381693 RepID=A0ABP0Q845_9DINO